MQSTHFIFWWARISHYLSTNIIYVLCPNRSHILFHETSNSNENMALWLLFRLLLRSAQQFWTLLLIMIMLMRKIIFLISTKFCHLFIWLAINTTNRVIYYLVRFKWLNKIWILNKRKKFLQWKFFLVYVILCLFLIVEHVFDDYSGMHVNFYISVIFDIYYLDCTSLVMHIPLLFFLFIRARIMIIIEQLLFTYLLNPFISNAHESKC